MENKKLNLNNTYDWFCNTIGNGVTNSVNSYFENNYAIKLVSINDCESLKQDPLLKGEIFYSCRISIKNKQHITLRVTSDFIRINFHDIFGSSSPVFDLEKLTPLEQRILNGLFEYIVKNIEKFLIKDTEPDKIDSLNKTTLNFDFLVKSKDVNAGKITLNIPLNRLSPENIKIENNFAYEDFADNFAYVDIIAGYAKISLNDLKTLNQDDILVLEKSDIKTMQLKTPTIDTRFKVNPDPSIMIDLGEEFDIGPDFNNTRFDLDYYKEYDMTENKTMWDDIQIEVSAEFKRIKMTLGELKQISKGLVIDLEPVMSGEISLMVENKAVARGELVIINDKYGVKITDVFASKKPTSNESPKKPVEQVQNSPPPKPISGGAKPQAVPKPQPSAQNQVQKPIPPQKPKAPEQVQEAPKDDLDYSNFEE